MDTTKVVLLGILAILVLAALVLTRRREQSAADVLAERYKRLTPELLGGLPDGELLRAVIANLIAKQHPRNPQPFRDIPALSPGRCAVYTVWLLTNELRADTAEAPSGGGDTDEDAESDWDEEGAARGGLAALLQSPSAPFLELAEDAFTQVGAPDCAALLGQAWEERALTLALVAEEFDDAWREACEREQPSMLCAAYIRANPEEFCDMEEDDQASDEEWEDGDDQASDEAETGSWEDENGDDDEDCEEDVDIRP